MLKIVYNLLFNYEKFRPTAMIDHFSMMKEIVDKDQIKYLILDKDDTIVPLHQFNVKDKKIHDTLSYFHHTGRFVFIVSNSVTVDRQDQPPSFRVNSHQHSFNILLTKVPKPFNGAQIQDIIKIHDKMNLEKIPLDKRKVAVVGDRLLTDIHLGNLMGWKSYLVKPMEQTTIKKHGMGVWMMRKFENFLINRSKFKRYQPTETKDQTLKDQTTK